jgi:hypothetical protein
MQSLTATISTRPCTKSSRSDPLTPAGVLAIHVDRTERYGGTHGVRDPGPMESDLFRPQTGYYADLVEQAAALWESLSIICSRMIQKVSPLE